MKEFPEARQPCDEKQEGFQGFALAQMMLFLGHGGRRINHIGDFAEAFIRTQIADPGDLLAKSVVSIMFVF